MRLQPANHQQRQPAAPQRSILLVDDSALIRDLCAKVFRHERVLQAASGEEALALLERERVDIVLTDVIMPGMSGLDLLEKIKSNEPNLAVVVMSGYAEKEVILRALKADADDFISKPVNLLQLRTTVDKVLEKKALKEELVQLKRMDRLKADFLGLVSHKLKTPITAISLFIQNLAQGIDNPDDPAFRETLRRILQESDYLGNLIQDLLHYSDVILQDATPQLEPIDVREVAQALVTELKDAAHGQGILLTASLPGDLPPLLLDQSRIRFALRALLDNAIKFSARGGVVSLTATFTATEVTLAVQDRGKGISEEEIPRIFEKFYQIDPARTGQVRGFGLGLFYARQFVTSHGGSLRLESTPGTGTTATIVLPR